MRMTRYFMPILKEDPAEAAIVSHRLMLRAGMIRQSSAGIYSWLPFGFKVLRKLENIVHEEQVRAGHIPMLMPTPAPRRSDKIGSFPGLSLTSKPTSHMPPDNKLSGGL